MIWRYVMSLELPVQRNVHLVCTSLLFFRQWRNIRPGGSLKAQGIPYPDVRFRYCYIEYRYQNSIIILHMFTNGATMSSTKSEIKKAPPDRVWTVFFLFLRLGLTSFGGPVAHLGYFRNEFVTRRRWLSERSYADLVALCQFLPGPASSQVGMALGMTQGGVFGALAAWTGFTLPSAIMLSLFAMSLSAWSGAFPPGALHGLKVVAVAVVA